MAASLVLSGFTFAALVGKTTLSYLTFLVNKAAYSTAQSAVINFKYYFAITPPDKMIFHELIFLENNIRYIDMSEDEQDDTWEH